MYTKVMLRTWVTEDRIVENGVKNIQSINQFLVHLMPRPFSALIFVTCAPAKKNNGFAQIRQGMIKCNVFRH